MNKYQSDFITNLKKYRTQKGLSQAELAEKCDVTTGTIGNIECSLAKPSFDLIIKIADILEIHPALLFATEDFFLRLKIDSELTKDHNFLLKLYKDLEEHFEK